jgi:phage-related protein
MKRLIWIGSSRQDLKEFPDEIQDEMGHALYLAQMGDRHNHAKTLSGLEVLKSSKFEKLIDRELIEWFTKLRWRSLFLYLCFSEKVKKRHCNS